MEPEPPEPQAPALQPPARQPPEPQPPEASVASDRCALHPERAAAGTCARCGSFMCGECSSPEVALHCASCAERLSRGRFVAQVPILAVAMMVHGALTAGMGLYYLVFGGFFAANLGTSTPRPEEGPGAELFAGLMFGALGVIAVAHLVPGVLQLWAGWRARTYRSRVLAFLALGSGLLTLIGCYCAPTSLGLAVWGVIVLAGEAVRDRFAAAAASGR